MNVTEIKGVFHCDCGFSWTKGKSGSHNCADGLRKKLRQLAAENVALKSKGKELLGEACAVYSRLNKLIDPSIGDFVDGQTLHEFQFVLDVETPATDRIVAEAEARGVEKAIVHLEKKFSNIGVQIMNLQWLADSLRERAK
ncbi:TPA: hypothetical protein MYK22_001010 [Klebsiella pneumoniae]|nr:hypothetical protein [Klebsiella pneumoniae]